MAETALSSRYPRCVCAFASRSAWSDETGVVGAGGVMSVMAVLRSEKSWVVAGRLAMVKNSEGNPKSRRSLVACARLRYAGA